MNGSRQRLEAANFHQVNQDRVSTLLSMSRRERMEDRARHAMDELDAFALQGWAALRNRGSRTVGRVRVNEQPM